MRPTLQPEQAQRHLEDLRHEADLAIARLLRAAAEMGGSPAEAISNLDLLTAVMHNDLRIYRRRLLAERPWRRRRPMMLVQS